MAKKKKSNNTISGMVVTNNVATTTNTVISNSSQQNGTVVQQTQQIITTVVTAGAISGEKKKQTAETSPRKRKQAAKQEPTKQHVKLKIQPNSRTNTTHKHRTRRNKKNAVTNTNNEAKNKVERREVARFWISLENEQRKKIIRVDKKELLKRIKEKHRHICSCTVCGRKRAVIDKEVERLYEQYYDELEFRNSQVLPATATSHLAMIKSDASSNASAASSSGSSSSTPSGTATTTAQQPPPSSQQPPSNSTNATNSLPPTATTEPVNTDTKTSQTTAESVKVENSSLQAASTKVQTSEAQRQLPHNRQASADSTTAVVFDEEDAEEEEELSDFDEEEAMAATADVRSEAYMSWNFGRNLLASSGTITISDNWLKEYGPQIVDLFHKFEQSDDLGNAGERLEMMMMGSLNSNAHHKSAPRKKVTKEEVEEEESSGEYEDEEYESEEEVEVHAREHQHTTSIIGATTTTNGVVAVAAIPFPTDSLINAENQAKQLIQQATQATENQQQQNGDQEGDEGEDEEGDEEEDEEEEDDDEEDEEEEEEDEEDDDEENDLAEEKKWRESKRMFRLYAAKLFFEKIVMAYREKLAFEMQEQLIQEEKKEREMRAAERQKKWLKRVAEKERIQKERERQEEEKRKLEEEQKKKEELEREKRRQKDIERKRIEAEKERITAELMEIARKELAEQNKKLEQLEKEQIELAKKKQKELQQQEKAKAQQNKQAKAKTPQKPEPTKNQKASSTASSQSTQQKQKTSQKQNTAPTPKPTVPVVKQEKSPRKNVSSHPIIQPSPAEIQGVKITPHPPVRPQDQMYMNQGQLHHLNGYVNSSAIPYSGFQYPLNDQGAIEEPRIPYEDEPAYPQNQYLSELRNDSYIVSPGTHSQPVVQQQNGNVSHVQQLFDQNGWKGYVTETGAAAGYSQDYMPYQASPYGYSEMNDEYGNKAYWNNGTTFSGAPQQGFMGYGYENTWHVPSPDPMQQAIEQQKIIQRPQKQKTSPSISHLPTAYITGPQLLFFNPTHGYSSPSPTPNGYMGASAVPQQPPSPSPMVSHQMNQGGAQNFVLSRGASQQHQSDFLGKDIGFLKFNQM